jgi:DNA-binding SARP family transcriptional activator
MIMLAANGRLDEDQVREAARRARMQRAESIVLGFQLLEGVLGGPESLGRSVRQVSQIGRSSLSVYAELLIPRLGLLDERAMRIVQDEAEARPTRWRYSLRREIQECSPEMALPAAGLLELVGDATDVVRLRRLSKALRGSLRRPDLGRQLARRIAPRVWVEDQGRVLIKVGGVEIPGTSVRRKALALLCYLLTRPGLSASRDQVLDALWPDQDPEQSANSLHQTAYFLRRVFEPSYTEDLSPGYLNHDVELLWLDSELVDSRGNACRRLLDSGASTPDPGMVNALSMEYRGPFALDFAYEEWASPHRESLHARYLLVMERAIQADIGAGHLDRAMLLSRRLLDVDPQVDEVERTLLRLYQAAAEQYTHYATTVRRDLGLEPPALKDI